MARSLFLLLSLPARLALSLPRPSVGSSTGSTLASSSSSTDILPSSPRCPQTRFSNFPVCAMADPTPRTSSAPAVSAITKIESIIGKDEGGRGMASLIVPGDLLSGAQRLARLAPRRARSGGTEERAAAAHVVVLSGFPCCVNDDPPTETDGPPGALAIARAAMGLGHRVTLVTDECNRRVFAAAADGGEASPSLELVTYPAEERMTDADQDGMAILVNSCDLIIACERAGPAADGNCYTMRGIDMTGKGLIAPLHRIVELGREIQSGKDGSTIPFVAIGDGGNEMGMGKVLEAIIANPKIKDGNKIAAVTPADDLIAASVSNWGGYALAAAAAVIRYDDTRAGVSEGGFPKTPVQEWVDKCVPTEEDEVALLNRCIEAGCRDGVSGKMEATVDGMPLETSMSCLRNIRSAALEAGDR